MENNDYLDYLYHHGIKGMHWGVLRFQNEDGSLTSLGKLRYGIQNKSNNYIIANRTKEEQEERNKKKSELEFTSIARKGSIAGRRATKKLEKMNKEDEKLINNKYAKAEKLLTSGVRKINSGIKKVNNFNDDVANLIYSSKDYAKKIYEQNKKNGNSSFSSIVKTGKSLINKLITVKKRKYKEAIREKEKEIKEAGKYIDELIEIINKPENKKKEEEQKRLEREEKELKRQKEYVNHLKSKSTNGGLF